MLNLSGKIIYPGILIGETVFFDNWNKVLTSSEASIIIVAEIDLTFEAIDEIALSRNVGLIISGQPPYSHLSLRIRSHQIVCMSIAESDLRCIDERAIGIIDANKGEIIIKPNLATLTMYKYEKVDMARLAKHNDRKYYKKSHINDEKKISVLASIGSINDAKLAISEGADGFGLIKMELLLFNSEATPNQSDIHQILRKIIEIAKGLTVSIRIADFGGDKSPHYLKLPREANPFLGCRGLRYYHSDLSLLHAQLAAIFRCPNFEQVRIVLPFISREDEIGWFINELDSAIKTLPESDEYQLLYNKLGVMLEIPGVIDVMQKMDKLVSHYSIGSNDLIQYLLAADRSNVNVHNYYDLYHPSVIRTIHRAAKNATNANKTIGLCGELAHNYHYIPFAIGIGIREFTVPPLFVLSIKEKIERLRMSDCINVANDVINADTSNDVIKILASFA